MKTKNLVFSAVAIILLGLIIWLGTGRGGSKSDSVEGISKLGDKALDSQPKSETATLEPTRGSFWDGIFSGGGSTYRDVSAGFSFKYPKEYSIKEIPAPAEGEARTLLLSKDGQAPSVQVAVSPFDENIVLTVERIEADAPDLAMKNPQAISIGSFTKGVKFDSDSGTNIWFVAKGNLFQLTALPTETSVLEEIVSSFRI